MDQETLNKWQYLIGQAEHVLIIPSPSNPEATFAAAGLSAALKHLTKQATVIATNEGWLKRYPFLSSWHVKEALEVLKEFVISVDTKKSGVKSLHYDRKEDSLNIHINPKYSNFSIQDVSFRYGRHSFDLVITIGIEHLDKLGGFYQTNEEVFNNASLININNRASELFGELNIINSAAATCTEAVFELIGALPEVLINSESANPLLCGILLATDGFANEMTSAQTMRVVAELIDGGGSVRKSANLIGFNRIELMPRFSTVATLIKQLAPPVGNPEIARPEILHRQAQGKFVVALANEKSAKNIPALKESLDGTNFFLIKTSEVSNRRFPCMVHVSDPKMLELLEAVVGGKTSGEILNFDIMADSLAQAQTKLTRLAEAAFSDGTKADK